MKALFLAAALTAYQCQPVEAEETDMNSRTRTLQLDLDEHARPKPPVAVIEPHSGRWTNSPAWGSGYQGNMPDSDGAEIPIFSLDGTYGPPRVHSISMFSRGVAGTNASLRARVRYGSGAVQNEFQADLINGMQFSVVADHLRITGVTWKPDGASAYNPASGAINVTACAAEGTVSKGVPLTYTEPLKTIFNGPTAFSYTVPPLARAVIVNIQGNSDPATASNISLRFLAGATIIASYDAQIMAGNMGGLVIPAGVDTLNVFNASAGNAVTSVQWILGL